MTYTISHTPELPLVQEFLSKFPDLLDANTLDSMLETFIVSAIYQTVATRRELALKALIEGNVQPHLTHTKVLPYSDMFTDEDLRLLSLRTKPALAGEHYNSVLNHQRMVRIILEGKVLTVGNSLWGVRATPEGFFAECRV